MNTVTSADGTAIAYDRTGGGDPLVLVGGAFSYRRYPGQVKLARLLAGTFTVYSYDRRGRGDSGDTAPYAVQREIEGLAAVIDAAGGSAHVWGLSSGAVLALDAAAAGVPVRRLAVQEPPLVVNPADRRPPPTCASGLPSWSPPSGAVTRCGISWSTAWGRPPSFPACCT